MRKYSNHSASTLYMRACIYYSHQTDHSGVDLDRALYRLDSGKETVLLVKVASQMSQVHQHGRCEVVC